MPDPNMRPLLIGFAQRGDGTEDRLCNHRLVGGVPAAAVARPWRLR